MASKPSWGPCIGNRPLKWTEKGPTNDSWMISDEFETFGDNHFWCGQTKTETFVQKIIHFIKIQNIHSKQIFTFLKIQNIHSKEKIILLKSRIFIQKKYSFFFKKGPYRPGLCATPLCPKVRRFFFYCLQENTFSGQTSCLRRRWVTKALSLGNPQWGR